jgi:hypothetical protein
VADNRIVHGARCTWWGSISEVGELPPTKGNPFGERQPGERGLPCCPHCRGVLMEVGSEAEWWAGVDRHEADGNPGYRAFVEWLRGQCFPNVTAARSMFDREAMLRGYTEQIRALEADEDGAW